MSEMEGIFRYPNIHVYNYFHLLYLTAFNSDKISSSDSSTSLGRDLTYRSNILSLVDADHPIFLPIAGKT